MMLDLRREDFAHDAVLPANSMWIRLGDKDLHRVSDEASIMRSPVVLGVKKSKARDLGWIDAEVKVQDILDAVKAGRLRFAMTSATQSNSGASAYMGLLTALAGRPEVLTAQDLESPELKDKIRSIFAGLDRSSGSSGWLKDMFLRKYDFLDGMFNYESMIISTNRQLVEEGREPLYVVYPVDGLAIADSTLGFVNKADNADRKELFLALRDHLLEPEAQDEIFATGFRTGLIGMNPEDVDRSIYNPDWGIDLERTISPITWPRAEVIEDALRLYQTAFRKPSFTVYLLDVSGSMEGAGLEHLKTAMTSLLNQDVAGRYFLEASPEDVTVIIPFEANPLKPMAVVGNDRDRLGRAINAVHSLEAGGGTNIYRAVVSALGVMNGAREQVSGHLPAIVLMTDGRSNKGSLAEVENYWDNLNPDFDFPPIFGVTFGDADVSQLDELTRFAVGRVFDGRKDLEKAFRKAKGYN
jgi:Ca-activated chloride channel family protein